MLNFQWIVNTRPSIQTLMYNSLSPSVVCWQLLQTVWTQIRHGKMLGLIWTQSVWHSGSWKIFFWKSWFWKKITRWQKSMRNFPRALRLKNKRLGFISFWVCSWELMESSTSLMPPSTGLSGQSLIFKDQNMKKYQDYIAKTRFLTHW